MDEEDYSSLLIPSFHTRYVYPPPHFVPQQPLPPPAPNVIIPTTGAAKYFYVDPSAPKNFNPIQNFDEQGHIPDQTEGIGLLPKNAVNVLVKELLGNAPRLADDRSELNDMLNQSPETKFVAPTPTPTPPVKKKGTSYAA